MGNKYQVLANIDGVTSVIEQSDREGRWKISVPDAGDTSTAVRLTRLLNQEEDRVVEIRRSRENDGIVQS